MSDFPQLQTLPPIGTISSASPHSALGQMMLTTASAAFTVVATAWPSANLAIYIPFVVESPCTVYQIAVENGATLNGNHDVGIYDWSGSKIVASGSTAQSGTSVLQLMNITDTVLAPGNYTMAMSSNSATATYRGAAPAARASRICGVQQQATAFALPASMTGAVMAQAFVPWIGLCLNATA